MLYSVSFVALSLVLSGYAQSPTYSATYVPSNAPYQSEQGQTGYNNCTTGYNQTSECQNAYVNSVQDWCVWAPPQPGPDSVIGNTEVHAFTSLFSDREETTCNPRSESK